MHRVGVLVGKVGWAVDLAYRGFKAIRKEIEIAQLDGSQAVSGGRGGEAEISIPGRIERHPVISIGVLPIHKPQGREPFNVLQEERMERLGLVRGEKPRHHQAHVPDWICGVCCSDSDTDAIVGAVRQPLSLVKPAVLLASRCKVDVLTASLEGDRV